MKEPIIVQSDVRSNVKLEGKHDFKASITIGLIEGGDFYIAIKFLDLTIDELKTLAELSKHTGALAIQSDLIDKENYNISHIVVTNFSATSNLSMTWECLSDDPSIYESLLIK